MRIETIHSIERLVSIREQWNKLAALRVFSQPEWLLPWWRHFSEPNDRLECVAIWDHFDNLVGFAPWYRSHRLRQLMFLGSGSVCTDHQTILVRATSAINPSDLIAIWLINQLKNPAMDWNKVVLESVDDSDMVMRRMLDNVEATGISVSTERSHQCWVLPLHGSWEAHLKSRTKNSRKELKRTWEQLQAQELHWLAPEDDIDAFMNRLVELHQRRWESQKEQGCFADSRFEGFLREVASQFHTKNQLWGNWIEHAGQSIATDFAILGSSNGRSRLHCYQAGIHPDYLHLHPGKLSNTSLVRRASDESVDSIDFLRGDEPYKKLLHAEPQSASTIHIVAPRLVPQLFEQARRAESSVKRIGKKVKSFLEQSFK